MCDVLLTEDAAPWRLLGETASGRTPAPDRSCHGHDRDRYYFNGIELCDRRKASLTIPAPELPADSDPVAASSLRADTGSDAPTAVIDRVCVAYHRFLRAL